MGIFRLFFLIFSCFFSFSVFSQGVFNGDGSPDVIIVVPEDHTVFDLCFSQLLQRRMLLQEEMMTVSEEMENAEGRNVVFSDYSSHIFQIMLKVNVLRLIEGDPIDISENTCDAFIDEALSDFGVRMATINNLFMSIMADTMEMVQYKFMETLEKKRRGVIIDENALEQLMRMMEDYGYVPNMDQGHVPDIDDGGHTTSGI